MKLILIILAISLPIQAIVFSPSDLKVLKKGELILTTKSVKGHTWPEITAYKLIKASVIDSMAIFAAYDYQKKYVPNIIRSEVTKQISPTNIEVTYEFKMPWPLPNGVYVHGHHLSEVNGDLKLDWYMVESNSADSVKGSAVFSYFGPGQTLMEYKSIVEPSSMFGRFLRKRMLSDTKNTLLKINKTIEELAKNSPKLTAKYRLKITSALQGKRPY